MFTVGRPLARAEIIDKLGCSPEILEEALTHFSHSAGGRGIALVDDGRMVELRVVGSAAEMVERVRKEEVSRDLGRAGQETLSAVLYRGPLSRSEIDFIRGVNSSQILRTLLVRGLVRRVANPKDERSFLYEPTTELLSERGVARASDLPDYKSIKARLEELETAYRARENSPTQS